MPSISTGRLCLFLLPTTLFLIVSVAWFFFAIPALIHHGSDIALFGAFCVTALWMVAAGSIVIHTTRKEPPVGR